PRFYDAQSLLTTTILFDRPALTRAAFAAVVFLAPVALPVFSHPGNAAVLYNYFGAQLVPDVGNDPACYDVGGIDGEVYGLIDPSHATIEMFLSYGAGPVFSGVSGVFETSTDQGQVITYSFSASGYADVGEPYDWWEFSISNTYGQQNYA